MNHPFNSFARSCAIVDTRVNGTHSSALLQRALCFCLPKCLISGDSSLGLLPVLDPSWWPVGRGDSNTSNSHPASGVGKETLGFLEFGSACIFFQRAWKIQNSAFNLERSGRFESWFNAGFSSSEGLR